MRPSHLATCRETIAPAFLTQAAGRNKTTTALATSQTATVMPCARAVCYSAPTCTSLAAPHKNWLFSPTHFVLEGARSPRSVCKATLSTKKYNTISYPSLISHILIQDINKFSPLRHTVLGFVFRFCFSPRKTKHLTQHLVVLYLVPV